MTLSLPKQEVVRIVRLSLMQRSCKKQDSYKIEYGASFVVSMALSSTMLKIFPCTLAASSDFTEVGVEAGRN